MGFYKVSNKHYTRVIFWVLFGLTVFDKNEKICEHCLLINYFEIKIVSQKKTNYLKI